MINIDLCVLLLLLSFLLLLFLLLLLLFIPSCLLRRQRPAQRAPVAAGRGRDATAKTPHPPKALKIHQRGVQWKQGVVVYMIL